MSNYPAGIGLTDIPGFRDSDVAAELAMEKWEESIDPHAIAIALMDYVECDLPPQTDYFKEKLMDAFDDICQRMTSNGHLPELAKLGAYFGVNTEEPA